MLKRTMLLAVVACVVVSLGLPAMGVTFDTVPVGNPGNAAEWSGETYGGSGPDRECGKVAYNYNIAKYGVTAGEYTEFLNAVAGVDAYGLYNTNMWSTTYGCKIERFDGSDTTGDPYQYRLASDWANRPVNYVSWGDAARFANWLTNDQPGLGGPPVPQDENSTEDGAYFLDGARSDAALLAVSREPDWKWAIPTEDEWYKAAYHKNDGVTGNYFDYPTSSDSTPGYVNDAGNLSGTGDPFIEGGTDPGNYATYDGDGGIDGIGSPYYRTKVGEWENSDSPYGTFDQSGNIWEWNEGIIDEFSDRGVRGAGSTAGAHLLNASYRNHADPSCEDFQIGFRVSEVPEPASAALLLLGLPWVLHRRHRR